MRFALGRKPDNWTVEVREWDVPAWFWEEFTGRDTSSQDWEQGLFAGSGRAPEGCGSITLNGVHFLRSSLDVLLPVDARPKDEQEQVDPSKPNLPEADLRRWWEKLGTVREALSQERLWAVAKSDHPDHTVSRERIRGLAEGRTPGPKPN